MNLGMLPRCTFTETGVGCAVHGDPTCLCDVVVGTPTPIDTHHGLTFGTLAVKAVGKLSAETFHEFASVLLGCADAYMELVVDAPSRQSHETPNEFSRRKARMMRGKTEQTPWMMLDDPTRVALNEAHQRLTPWPEAAKLLPPTAVGREYIAKVYNIRLSRARRKAKLNG